MGSGDANPGKGTGRMRGFDDGARRAYERALNHIIPTRTILWVFLKKIPNYNGFHNIMADSREGGWS